MKNCIKKSLKASNGITLIALVVTIIVLLILAGISISMLSGNNGILQRATDAKEQTDIAQIKERAELVKMGLQIDSFSRPNSDKIKQNVLVSAIHEEFEGSTYKGSKVITADKKYDIIVDTDLNITVVKHQDATAGTVVLTYEANPQQNGVYINVFPTIESENSVPSYDVWAQGELEGKTEEQIAQIFVEGQNYWNQKENWGEPIYADIYELMEYWGENYCSREITTIAELCDAYEYENLSEFAISWNYVKPQEYEEKYVTTIKIACGEENYTITPLEQSYVEFWIENGGEYNITATASDGSTGETTVDVHMIIPTSIVIFPEGTDTLTATGKNETLIWNSSEPSVATVENGVVTAKSKGTTTITVTNDKGLATSNLCTVIVKDIEIYTASDISSSTNNTFYGKTVNYPVAINTSSYNKWKIFYSDGTNIFLIPDSYVRNTSLPLIDTISVPTKVNAGLTPITQSNWQANWKNIPTEQIITNLNSSFMFTGWTNYSDYDNGKCVSTMLNTNNWKNFVNSIYADYAIGGATIEMYCASWNAKGTGDSTTDYKTLYWDNTNKYGYNVTDGVLNYANMLNSGNLSAKTGYYDSLYYPERYTNNACAYWLASPLIGSGGACIMAVGHDGLISGNGTYMTSCGFRPIVRLKTGVRLKTSAMEEYDYDLMIN